MVGVGGNAFAAGQGLLHFHAALERHAVVGHKTPRVVFTTRKVAQQFIFNILGQKFDKPS